MPEPHADRSTGLVFFGVLQVLLGLLSIVLLLRTAATVHVNVAQSLFLFSAAAFYFVVTGIGSMRGRRWARALIAAVSGSSTGVGTFGFVLMFVGMPQAPTRSEENTS